MQLAATLRLAVAIGVRGREGRAGPLTTGTPRPDPVELAVSALARYGLTAKPRC